MDVRSTVRGGGGSVDLPAALVVDSPSPAIVLLPERASASTYYVNPLDADGNTIAASAIVLGPGVIGLWEL